MTKSELISFLQKELGVEGIVDAGGWVRGCCPTHGETRASWGVFAEAEHHPTKCFLCGAGTLVSNTMTALSLSYKEALKLIRKYGTYGDGLNREQLINLSLPTFEDRHKKNGIQDIGIYELAPYLGKGLHIVKRRYPYDEEYLKHLKLGVDKINRRIVIPWFFNGKLLGATGRFVKKTPPPQEPKTMPYFGLKKGSALYLPSGKILRKPLVLVEGEGDAMSVYRVYDNVAAVGNASFTKLQRQILSNYNITDVVIFKDPDEGGDQFVHTVRKYLHGVAKVGVVQHRRKDAGDCLKMEIKRILNEKIELEKEDGFLAG